MLHEYSPTDKSKTRDEALVDEIIRHFMVLNSDRSIFASHWEEVAALVRPTSRNTFMYGNVNTPGQKYTERQIDATAMMALDRFGAIMDSMLTPANSFWHQLTASNEDVMKDRASRLWFEKVTKILFKLRYSPISNFSSQNQQFYQELGAFGTDGMFIDKYQGPDGSLGFRYKALPLGELFLIQNHQGLVEGFIRWFRFTAHEAWCQWKDNIPAQLRAALEKNSQERFDFLHYVIPNAEYQPGMLDHRGKLFKSCYVSMAGRKLMSENGYNSLPIAASRYNQAPNEVYGRSPAMAVLPAMKTLNAEKAMFLKQGHRAADPVLLLADDGLMNADLRPGASNVGGMSAEGKPLVGVLPTGDIQVTLEMMQEEKTLINDAFLVTLFKILLDDPKIFTATQVVEMASQRGILIAPTIGRQQSEYLGPLINRELDLAAEMGLLPPMPPALQEANGEYEAVYTSPLSKARRMQEVSGVMRTIETATGIVNITQDPTPLDNFNFDKILPEVASIQNVPETWMASPEEIKAKRDQRAELQKQQMQIQAAPAQAALMKAQQTAKG